MESKTHWAWESFGNGLVPKERLHHHFEQEYEVYIRDFPILIGRAFVQCPIPEVRRELAENLYEEETGNLVAGKPHPELFLEYPKGLGFELGRFSQIELRPKAKVYRDWLDESTHSLGWEVAAAVSTLFIEGTQYERGELDPHSPKKPSPPLEEHPLVKYYGLGLESLALTKAHRQVEGEHRAAAWRILLNHISPEKYDKVIQAMNKTCVLWKTYRDEIASYCGLEKAPDGNARLKSTNHVAVVTAESTTP
ncbi:MAG: iron-containing redox enzyme family protein [Myxococcota bacterium]|nr:iron-containing redox enzyme family protein [Myxococcota bacterium]